MVGSRDRAGRREEVLCALGRSTSRAYGAVDSRSGDVLARGLPGAGQKQVLADRHTAARWSQVGPMNRSEIPNPDLKQSWEAQLCGLPSTNPEIFGRCREGGLEDDQWWRECALPKSSHFLYQRYRGQTSIRSIYSRSATMPISA